LDRADHPARRSANWISRCQNSPFSVGFSGVWLLLPCVSNQITRQLQSRDPGIDLPGFTASCSDQRTARNFFCSPDGAPGVSCLRHSRSAPSRSVVPHDLPILLIYHGPRVTRSAGGRIVRPGLSKLDFLTHTLPVQKVHSSRSLLRRVGPLALYLLCLAADQTVNFHKWRSFILTNRFPSPLLHEL
jgi:hypothetical protein